MADRRLSRASVRLRTTALAVLVVAVAMLAGAVALVVLVRGSLTDGLETTAEQRAADIAAQITATGSPPPPSDDDDLAWRVTRDDETVAVSSWPLGEEAVEGTADSDPYRVTVAVSREEIDDAIAALLTPLAVGIPLILLLVGGTTWLVVTRALAPVERIRREVEEITGDRLDRRVPEPASRDEIHRLARTMNRMLGRLEAARTRQQQFVADASHELRSPVAAIRQVAEVTHAHPAALDPREMTGAVLAESARLQRLVEQLLTLSRMDGGGMSSESQDVDLDDLVLAEARRVGRAGLVVDTSGVGGGRVRGDRAALAQVVRNLVDNAARHARSRLALAVRSPGGLVELVVEDDGSGIPADQRERVFERFVRLDEARARDDGGSGLGLAIVREVVTAHDGTVEISSGQLGGARFVVRFRSGGIQDPYATVQA